MDHIKHIQVAMIEPVGGHGGMDYYDFGLCEGLAQADVTVVLYTCDKTKTPENSKFSVLTWFRGIYDQQPRILRGLRFVFAAIRVFHNIFYKKIPLVHFHFFDVSVLHACLIFVTKMMRRKVIITVHDVEGFFEGKGNSRIATVVYGWADALVVHNQYSRAELITLLQVDANKVAVIPHGNYCHAYPNTISLSVAREQLGWPQTEKVLLFFGQIKGVKRLDLLLAALPDIIDKHPNIRLVIAGKEVDVPFDIYAEQIIALGVADKCSCLIRYISNEEVPLFYAACDLVILPYERIYQSGVLLMAMSFAKAVVVSDIPGMMEVITDGSTGYIFRNGNSQDLSNCVVRALNNTQAQNQIAHQGLQLMKGHYSWSSIGNRHAELYANLLKGYPFI